MKLNNYQFAASFVVSIGFGFAVVQKDCRRPYVEAVIPAALAAYTKSDGSNKSSDSEKKVKNKSKDNSKQ